MLCRGVWKMNAVVVIKLSTVLARGLGAAEIGDWIPVGSCIGLSVGSCIGPIYLCM
jgi:hypothetical protein